MTARNGRDQFLREFKASWMARLARKAMTTRTTGLDGFAKRMLEKVATAPSEPDPELEHPADWDRPID